MDMKLLLLVMALLSSYVGLACFAVSQRQHWRAVAGKSPKEAQPLVLLKVFGFLFLVMALGLAWLRDGPAFGVLLWIMTTNLATLLVALTVTFRPQSFRRLCSSVIGKKSPSLTLQK